jgi:hypothetical protein
MKRKSLSNAGSISDDDDDNDVNSANKIFETTLSQEPDLALSEYYKKLYDVAYNHEKYYRERTNPTYNIEDLKAALIFIYEKATNKQPVEYQNCPDTFKVKVGEIFLPLNLTRTLCIYEQMCRKPQPEQRYLMDWLKGQPISFKS